MKTSKIDATKNFSARVEIIHLEQKGWDFSDLYQEVANAQQLSIEDAQKWDKENYCVAVTVNEDGGSYYEMCQKAHYGNECFYQGDTGDNEATIQDLKELYENGLLWDCKQL